MGNDLLSDVVASIIDQDGEGSNERTVNFPGNILKIYETADGATGSVRCLRDVYPNVIMLRSLSLRASSQTGAAIRFSQTILTDSHVAALLGMTIFA